MPVDFRVGPHLLRWGDHAKRHWGDLRPEGRVLFYTSPPTTPSTAQYWRSEAGLPGEVNVRALHHELGRIATLVCADPVMIETRDINWLRGFGEMAGWPPLVHVGSCTHDYGVSRTRARAQLQLLVFSTWPLSFEGVEPRSWAMLSHAVKVVRPDVVVDPCIGCGLAVKAARTQQAAVWGMDFNRKRLEIAVRLCR